MGILCSICTTFFRNLTLTKNETCACSPNHCRSHRHFTEAQERRVTYSLHCLLLRQEQLPACLARSTSDLRAQVADLFSHCHNNRMQLSVDGFWVVTHQPHQQLQALHCYFPAKQRLHTSLVCNTSHILFEVFGKGVAENCVLRNDVLAIGIRILSFRGNLLSPSSRIEMNKRIFRRLETKPVHCLDTSESTDATSHTSRTVSHSKPAVPKLPRFMAPLVP